MGLINTVNCDKEDLGLGIVECMQYFGEPEMPILVKKGWSMTRTAFEALTADDFIGLVQQGTIIPIPGMKQFTMDIPDPTNEEYSGGVISVVRNGKPVLRFDFDKGIAFHRALYSKNSFKNYDTWVVDASGNLMLATSADGSRVTALTTGMVNTRTYAFKSGDTSANTQFEFQLTNEEQFNRRMAVYSTDQSGIDFNEILRPITSVVITGTAEAGEPINVNVRAWSNEGYGIEGMIADNFRVVNDVTKAVVPVSTVVPGAEPGSYAITPTTPTTDGQKLKVQTYDATATPAVNVALIEPNQTYKGVSDVITVAA